MAEPYTIRAGYSGPFMYDAAAILQPVVIDVFATSSLRIAKAPANFPGALREEVQSFQFTLEAGMRTWTRVRSALGAGPYRWTYLEGALNSYADPAPSLTWNLGYPGVCSEGSPLKGPTARPWLRSGGLSSEQFWFPGFDPLGLPTAEVAESFLAGTSTLFTHVGGPLDAMYDADTSVGPAQGSVRFEITSVPLPPGDGFWAVVYSSLPDKADWPTIAEDEVKAEFPTVANLKPGVHHLRFYSISLARKYRWQDYWLWVWKTQPRAGSSDYVAYTDTSRDTLRAQRYATVGIGQPLPWEIFPVRPPVAPGNKVGTPLLDRQYFEQPAPSAGNASERPATRGNLPKEPETLGDSEAF